MCDFAIVPPYDKPSFFLLGGYPIYVPGRGTPPPPKLPPCGGGGGVGRVVGVWFGVGLRFRCGLGWFRVSWGWFRVGLGLVYGGFFGWFRVGLELVQGWF